LDVSTVTAAELDRFKAWFYLEVLKSDFPNGREVVGICDIGELKQLKKFLKTVPIDGGRWGAVPDFFGRLRLMPGIELKWWFDDGPGPWIIVCQPNQDFTWALLKGSVLKVLQKGMGHGSHWGVIANPVKRKARA
jgi:hypothetical protein